MEGGVSRHAGGTLLRGFRDRGVLGEDFRYRVGVEGEENFFANSLISNTLFAGRLFMLSSEVAGVRGG